MLNPRSDTGWRQLVRRLCHLLHSWWHTDRIRVSPAEGRLLRLQPPCMLMLGGQPVELLRRTVCRTPGCWVVYACRTRSGSGKLIVRSGDVSHGPDIVWQEAGRTKQLSETDIDVFAAKSGEWKEQGLPSCG